MNEVKTYKVIEKPHPTFPYVVGDMLKVPHDTFEWMGSDGKLRQQRLSNNFCFQEVNVTDVIEDLYEWSHEYMGKLPFENDEMVHADYVHDLISDIITQFHYKLAEVIE